MFDNLFIARKIMVFVDDEHATFEFLFEIFYERFVYLIQQAASVYCLQILCRVDIDVQCLPLA